MEVKIIVGLGNPGEKYQFTRHNAGFLALDHYLKGKPAISCESKFQGIICEMHFHATKTFFVKPKTYMNNSGDAVKEISKYYKIDIARDLLVIHDEIDLPFGEIKTTHSSRAAGHNGVQSIIDVLGSQDFHRLRIGIESRSARADFPTQEYVLSPFTSEEQRALKEKVFVETDEIIEKFILAS